MNPNSFCLQALKVLDDDMQCDIIKIGNIIRNKVSLTLNCERLQDGLVPMLTFSCLIVCVFNDSVFKFDV